MMSYADTPAGWFRAKLGLVTDDRRSLAEIDHDVELADRNMAETRGRHLTDDERDIARRAAAYHEPGVQSPTLGLPELHALGYGISVPGINGGISVRYHTGDGQLHVEGDPAVAERAETAMAVAARRQREQLAESGGPLAGVPHAH